MASNKSKRHIHKYHRVETSGDRVWACALAECNHHMPAHMTRLVEGKASLCWTCEEKFILDVVNMRMDRPKCDDCTAIAERLKQIQSAISE